MILSVRAAPAGVSCLCEIGGCTVMVRPNLIRSRMSLGKGRTLLILQFARRCVVRLVVWTICESMMAHSESVSFSIDQRRHVPRAKSIINIDHADVRGAGVHHAEQGRQSLKCGAVTDAGWDGDHRNADQSADYAGQGAFHPRADYDHSRFGERPAMSQQAVNAGNADV